MTLFPKQNFEDYIPKATNESQNSQHETAEKQIMHNPGLFPIYWLYLNKGWKDCTFSPKTCKSALN